MAGDPGKPSSLPCPVDILEIRIKEVIDVSSFWAQIGTMKHLVDFENQQKRMSAWCEGSSGGCHQTASPLKLEDLVAVRGETEGTWVRAKVTKIITDKLVELFYVDTGANDYSDVRSICKQPPPMLCDTPQQALQCLLNGVKLPEDQDSCSKEVETRFKELTSTQTKAQVHQVLGSNCISVSVYTPYKGTFTSVGEILRREGMVQYEPCSPLTLDLPVTCELEPVLTGMQQVMPVKTYVKSEVYKQEAHRVEPVMPVSSKDDIGSMTTGDSGIPEQTPAGDDSIAIDEGSCITEQTSMTQVASVHLAPKTPPLEDFPLDSDPDYAEDGSFSSPPLLVIEEMRSQALPPAEDVGVVGGFPQQENISQAVQEDEQVDQVVSELDALDVATFPVDKQEDGTSAPDKQEDGTSALDKPSRLESDTESSGSSLSDNDWFDEGLLPHRSGTSEVSDALLESPQKPEAAPQVTRRPRNLFAGSHISGAVQEVVQTDVVQEVVLTDVVQEVVTEKPQDTFTINHVLKDSYAGNFGNSPYPHKPARRGLYIPRSAGGSGTSQQNWRVGRGRGKGGDRRGDLVDRERYDPVRKGGGRGRAARDKVYGSGSFNRAHRKSPVFPELPVTSPFQFPPPSHVSKGPRYSGDGKGPSQYNSDSKGLSQYNSVGKGPSRYNSDGRGPFQYNSDGRGPSQYNSDGKGLSHYNSDSKEYNSDGKGLSHYNSDSKEYNSDGKGPSQYNSDGKGPQYNSDGKGPQYNSDCKGPSQYKGPQYNMCDGKGLSHQYSSEGREVKSDCPAVYRQQISGMSKCEVEDEVKWQEWKMEKEMGKLLSELNSDSVKDFGEAVARLIYGPIADKLGELPKCRDPLEIVLEYLLKEGVNENRDLPLLSAAFRSIMEGSTRDADVARIWVSVTDKMASLVTEDELENKEGARKCHAFCRFLGSLFSSSGDSRCRDAVIKSVTNCLVSWSKLTSVESYIGEQKEKLQVDCFGVMLDCMDIVSNKAVWEEVIIQLLDGPVMECVLCDGYPRYIRQAWYTEQTKLLKVFFKEHSVMLPSEAPPTTGVVDSDNHRPVLETGHQVYESNSKPDANHENPQWQQRMEPIQPQHGMELQVMLPQQQQQRMESNQPQHGMELNCEQAMLPQQQQQRMESNQPQHGMELNYKQAIQAYYDPHPHALPPPEMPHFPPHQLLGGSDSYSRIKNMLDALRMTELFPTFRTAMIKDSVLDCDTEKIKDCLKDAGVPLGAVLEIINYLERSKQMDSERSRHYIIPNQMSQPPSNLALPSSNQISQPPSNQPAIPHHFIPSQIQMPTPGSNQMSQPLTPGSNQMSQPLTPGSNQMSQPLTPGSNQMSQPLTPGSNQMSQPLTPGSNQMSQPLTPGSNQMSQPLTPGSNQMSQPLTQGSNQMSQPLTPGSNQMSQPLTPGSNQMSQPLTQGSNQMSQPLTQGSTINPRHFILNQPPTNQVSQPPTPRSNQMSQPPTPGSNQMSQQTTPGSTTNSHHFILNQPPTNQMSTPGSNLMSQARYISNQPPNQSNSNQHFNQPVMLSTPYQMLGSSPNYNSPAGYPPVHTAEGACYAGGGRKPASPLTTAYQMFPLPVGNKPVQQQQQSSSASPVVVESPATGERVQTPTSSLPPTLKFPEGFQRRERSRMDVPPSHGDHTHWPSLSERQNRATSPQRVSTGRSEGTGFGSVNCVVCGGMDHVTSNCTQRSKFFTHM